MNANRPPVRDDMAVRSADDVRRDLSRARNELRASANALRVAVDRRLDWRATWQANAAPLIVGAFLLGALLGARR